MIYPFEFKYTSAVEKDSQDTASNSLGGHISTNDILTNTTASTSLYLDSTTVTLGASQSDFSGWVLVGQEVLSGSIAGTTLTIADRAVLPPQAIPNLSTSKVMLVSSSMLFDNDLFKSTQPQYRCIAVKNTSASTLSEIKVEKLAYRDLNVTVDIGIEVPKHGIFNGAINSVVSETSFSCNDLIGDHEDDYYAGSVLLITSGSQNGSYSTVLSYDGATGTFVLKASVGLTVAGDTFRIEPAPSQMIRDGLTSPNLNDGRFYGFFGDGGVKNLTASGIHNGTLAQNELFYLWIRKSTEKNKKQQADSLIMPCILFKV